MRNTMPKCLIACGVILAIFAGVLSIGLAQDETGVVTLTVLHTSDEHGWLNPGIPSGSSEIRGGAANVVGWWREREGYDPDSTLILSSGDNWTGQSISTLLQGKPMVDIFNQIGYDAVAIGNHEFDFGQEVMQARFAEADFPYLSANIRDAKTGELADFAQPYTILEVNGLQVGIIGLTTISTAIDAHPSHVSDLVFTDYGAALEEFVPQMRGEGAEIVLLLAHVCPSELSLLALEMPDMVDAMFAGHCHQLDAYDIAGVPILSSGEYLSSYTRLTLSYDSESGEIIGTDYDVVTVSYVADEGNPVAPDMAIAALIEQWQAELGTELTEEIGYTETGIVQRSPEMGNWVTDAWLWAFPNADIAITNWGGFRQDLPADGITVEDIVNILPFDNSIVMVELTAQQLAENLHCCGGAVAGMTYQADMGGVFMFLADGGDFDREATYRVLVNDFMYNGGSGYLFSEQDPDGYNTGIHWREPVINYTASLNTSQDNPLEDYLDFGPRGQ